MGSWSFNGLLLSDDIVVLSSFSSKAEYPPAPSTPSCSSISCKKDAAGAETIGCILNPVGGHSRW